MGILGLVIPRMEGEKLPLTEHGEIIQQEREMVSLLILNKVEVLMQLVQCILMMQQKNG